MLRDEIKVSMRISHDALNDEIDTLIAACFEELERVGVSVPEADKLTPLYKIAAELYVKYNMDYFGKGDECRRAFESLRDALAMSSAYRSEHNV